MAGFLDNLFGKKEPKVPKEDSFFLDADSAKTVGDIEYMRKTSSVRRTFPKTKTGGGGDITITLSSMEKADEAAIAPSKSASVETPKEPKALPKQADSSMDMFRNMAKEIRKP